MTYNTKQGFLGAISVTNEIAYHLFSVNADCSDAKNVVKLTRKSKWHSQHSEEAGNSQILFDYLLSHQIIMILLLKGNFINGLDLSPLGTSMASIDRYGVCLISDVNTNGYRFHTSLLSSNLYVFYFIRFRN